jgi:hypothetical protein
MSFNHSLHKLKSILGLSYSLQKQILSYEQFIKTDCKEKTNFALKYSIDYVYSSEFNCPNFQLINKSKEKLYLYKYFN